VVDSCEAGTPALDDATCDGVDDDCDGLADEEYAPQATTCGVGVCGATGVLSCEAGQVVDSCEAGTPALSDTTCDGIDDDCDGGVDEDYLPEATTCGLGACGATGLTLCEAGQVVDSCQAAPPIASDDATCDGVDDDCDGVADEDYVSQATTCGVGACGALGLLSCESGRTVDSCESGAPAHGDATCDGIDDDCDGLVDEDYTSRACGTGDPGICAPGTTRCELGAERCEADLEPQAEICDDRLDNDCDGVSDFPDDPSCVLTRLDIPVSIEEDDAEERVPDRVVSLKSADLQLTQDGDTLQIVGVRFASVDVPPGAIVVSAHIQFSADESSSGQTALAIQGEASDDAGPLLKDVGNLSGRARTAGAVPWEPAPWVMGASGPDQRTPSLVSLVQEIVDRPGWETGNAMVFVISGAGQRTAHASHGSPDRAPRLELEYVISTP
jgi:hypothetical protein